MQLNSEFLGELLEKISEKIDTDEIASRAAENAAVDADEVFKEAVDNISESLGHRDLEEAVVDAVVEDIDHNAIIRAVVGNLADDDDFKEQLIDAIADRILKMLCREEPRAAAIREEVQQVEQELTTTPREIIQPTGGAIACRSCGGSMFMHRNGCPVRASA